jgi:hypothetical protein
MFRKIAVLLLSLFMVTAVYGQFGKKEKKPTERTVNGVVLDASGAPVPGAVVQLKNMKTLAVRSFIARDKGDFVFNGLSMDVDWEFKAEANGHSSGTRTVSTFDSHPELNITLQLK